MKCQLCNKEQEMFWKDKEHLNGSSEVFFTNKDGKTVCMNCLTESEVDNFKGLHELNEDRKMLSKEECELCQTSIPEGDTYCDDCKGQI